jgi:hypothetical protein
MPEQLVKTLYKVFKDREQADNSFKKATFEAFDPVHS